MYYFSKFNGREMLTIRQFALGVNEFIKIK